MQGKILIYNEQTGQGKIITPERRQIDFPVDAWVDYETMPRSGLLVSFEILNGKIHKIETLKSSGSPTGNRADSGARASSSSSKSSPNASARADSSSLKKSKNTPQSKRPAHTAGNSAPPRAIADKALPIQKIRIDKPLDECIDEYFEQYLDMVQEHSKALAMNKTLDFAKMRRFLYTAYNNLKQIDRSISTEKFKELEREVKSLQLAYDNFNKISKQPHEVAFEKAFLSKQTDYLLLMKKARECRGEVDDLTALERRLKGEIAETQKKLEVFANDPVPLQELTRQFKKIKKRYADAIHGISSAKDLGIVIVEMVEEFREEYLDSFTQLFEQNIKYFRSKMIKILNAKAYQFDYLLWINAKQSPYIKQFFSECKIEGTYSSKTFLKYYIKTLDKEKLTDENRRLFELLKYLEETYTKKILVLCKTSDTAEIIKEAVENIEKDIVVKASTSPVDSLTWCKQNHPELVFLETELKLMGAFEFIQSYHREVEGVITDFCLLHNKEEFTAISKENLRQIRYRLQKPFTQKELAQQLVGIL